ncbi:hypothetical protein WDU94_008916 [Cyamophila willieti]
MEYQTSFDCIATGSFHQGNKDLFPTTANTQCVANATCALAVNLAGIPFNASNIDDILMTGDRLYQTVQACRERRRLTPQIYLDPEELVSVTHGEERRITLGEKRVQIDRVEWVNQGVWPSTSSAIPESISSLTAVLESEMTDEGNGFLFTGLSSTVSFWRRGTQFFLFDSHAVNSERMCDYDVPHNNRARLFLCSSFEDLAGLLLNRVSNWSSEYSIHRVFLSMESSSVLEEPNQQLHIPPPEEPMVVSRSVDMELDVEGFRSSRKGGRPQKKKRSRKAVLNRSVQPDIVQEAPSTPKNTLTPARLTQLGTPRTPVFEELDKEGVVYSPRQDPKLYTLAPVVCVKRWKSKPKKIKRGRPKTLETTQEEQMKAAKKRYADSHSDVINEIKSRYVKNNPEVGRKAAKVYTEKHPDVNQEAVRRYTQEHPEVHRDAVQRYSLEHPEVNREAVHNYSQQNPDVSGESTRRYDSENPEDHLARNRRFRANNPTDAQMRHVPVILRRLIRENGPMAYWDASLFGTVPLYKLEKSNLSEEGVYFCVHCRARLFEEERERKKWCCGQGAYNVLELEPLEAPFYQNRTFLQRARAYNDMFAFCAMTLSGEERHPRTGLAFFKIDGRMYHKVHNLDAPGRRLWDGTRARLVNQSRLYLDDGE